MTKSIQHLMTAGVIAVGLLSSTGIGLSASEPTDVASLPADLQAPAGNTPFLQGRAEGTQNYVCLPSSSGFAWTFFAPQATVFVTFKLTFGGDLKQQITTHFLSPNPSEGGMPRVTWQSSTDTSKVWGRSIASSNDPNVVAAGAIPWLLLQVVGADWGTMGTGILAGATFVQRLNTLGGLAPATGCSEAANVGSTALVPYAADYFFYKATQ